MKNIFLSLFLITNLNVSAINFGDKPIIYQQPQDIVANWGDSATATIKASGVTPILYIWYFNSQVIKKGQENFLEFDYLTPANCGNYYVLVVNSKGFCYSRVFSVSLNQEE